MTNRREYRPAAASASASASAEAFEEEATEGEDGGLESPAVEGGGDALDDETFDQREITKRKKKKVRELLLPAIRRLEELYVEKKEKQKKRRAARPPAVPFPYAYDDPAASRGCFVCCSSPPPVSDDVATGANLEPGTKPSRSSYRWFLKSMLEKNDFYSKECNVHGNIRQPKTPEDVG